MVNRKWSNKKHQLIEDNPKLTIITATYNSGKVIQSLIESLKVQSSRSFEWVVIDGQSTDETLEKVKSIDDFPVQLVSEPDFGIYDALNKGVLLSRANYYVVIGSDDKFYENAIENFINNIDSSKADIVAANVRAGDQIYTIWHHRPTWYARQFAYVAGHAVCTAFKKSLHDQAGYYSRKYPIAADELFIMQACKNGAKVHEASFVAGEFNLGGVSHVDRLGSIAESLRVQVACGSPKWLQILLFIYHVVRNYKTL